MKRSSGLVLERDELCMTVLRLRISIPSPVALPAARVALHPLLARGDVYANDVEMHGSQMRGAFALRKRPDVCESAEDMVDSLMAARQHGRRSRSPLHMERASQCTWNATGLSPNERWATTSPSPMRTFRTAFPEQSFEVSRLAGVVTQGRRVVQVRCHTAENKATLSGARTCSR